MGLFGFVRICRDAECQSDDWPYADKAAHYHLPQKLYAIRNCYKCRLNFNKLIKTRGKSFHVYAFTPNVMYFSPSNYKEKKIWNVTLCMFQ